MDIKNLFSTITSLVPFWASSLIEYFGLGNEYSVLFNVLLQQIITPLEQYITETILYIVLSLCAIIMLCYKHQLIDMNSFKLYNKKTLTIVGNEKDDIIDYCDSMNALTRCFIEEFNYCDILVSKHTKNIIMLQDVKNRRLKNDLYLDIVRRDNKVTYMLSSYNIDLNQFISSVLEKYALIHNKNYIHLYGHEKDTTYSYSQALISLSYTLIHKYNLTNLINKKSEDGDHKVQEDEDGKVKKALTRMEKIKQDKKEKAIYLLDEYIDYQLENDLYISITRIGEVVKYSLYSSTHNLIEFLDKCENYYNTNINNTKYKYRLIIQGTECSESRGKAKTIYPKEILAINYYLIFVKNHKNYRIIQNLTPTFDKYGDDYYEDDEVDQDINMFKYVLEDVGSIMFDDLVLTIKRYNHGVYSTTGTTVDYIFESDTVEIEPYINSITKKYDDINKKKNENKIYHFTLTKFDDGHPEFNHEMIYDNEPLMYESFDNISSVHNELLINDMKKLKDIEYYKKTGMKRKKSYLFYGEPGCGKTASVIALALHDKRHIIEIPMSLITTCRELEEIMNLDEINDISFKKDQVIILFDELDVGLSEALTKRHTKKEANEQKEKKDVDDEVIDVADEIANTIMEKYEKVNKPVISTIKDIELNIGALLSKFDGICNYNGLVIIGTTNHKDKLDPALCREQRLTPIYFTYCRNIDVENIIEKFFDTSVKIDFKINITPAKITFLCEKYNYMKVEEFVSLLKENIDDNGHVETF